MNLYEATYKFDPNTGEKLKDPELEIVGVLCDFSGEEAEFSTELGPTYEVNYEDVDPCIGCNRFEYRFKDKWKVDLHNFLLEPFVLDDDLEGFRGTGPALPKLIEASSKDPEMKDQLYMDQLLRWARIKTADRLLDEGKYTLSQLGFKEH